MDALEDFNPLDVLAAAAALQSPADQSQPLVPDPTNHEPEHVSHNLPDQPLVQWKVTPFLDHSYAYIPRDDENDLTPNGHDATFQNTVCAVNDLTDYYNVTDYDDVDSATGNGPVTEPEPEAEAEVENQDDASDGQLFIVLDDELIRNSSLVVSPTDASYNDQTSSDSCTKHNVENSARVTSDADVLTSQCAEPAIADLVDGQCSPKQDATCGQLETNNNLKIMRDDSQIVPGSDDLKQPLQIVTSEQALKFATTNQALKFITPDEPLKIVTPDLENNISESCIPGSNIPKMSPQTDTRTEHSSNDVIKSDDVINKMTSNNKAAISIDQVVPKLVKPHELFVKKEGLLSDKLVSPPAHDVRHACVSIDCCSPSDISAVARDLCVDRLSSASSQDLYTEDGMESPRSLKMAISPPCKPKRHQRGIYNIPLGPLVHDAQNRPEHPLKDHDYCLHSFYLAMTHNRIDEPVRRPGPQPKSKDQKLKRTKSDKVKTKKKRRSREDFDSDLSPFKEDVFSDTDSLGLDSPSKSRMSSPTNSLTGTTMDLRERFKMRDKRMNSLPNFLDKPKESTAMSNFNDNYVFFGRKPKRRNRTIVENNHDKLKKFNHSEFLPGLDISYIEARAKFHKKCEPDTKTEQEIMTSDPTVTSQEMNFPRGGLAFGISEEESQFIDSLHCGDSTIEAGFHSHEEITHEQVQELLTAVGEDNALKLIEVSGLHNHDSLNSSLNSLPHTDMSMTQYPTTENQFQNTESDFSTTENQFQSTENQFQNTENQFENTENQCKNTENQFQNTENQFENTENQFQNTENRFQNTENQFQNTENRLEETANKYPSTDTQENVEQDKKCESMNVSMDISGNLEQDKSGSDPVASTPTRTPTRPKDLPFSPLKNGLDLPSLNDNAMPNLVPDLGEHLPSDEMNDSALLGGTTPELHLGNVSDLGGTTPDLPLGGTTPHDLLDLDDTDLLNANLKLDMNSLLNFQSPDKLYHPSAVPQPRQPPQPIGAAQRKLDLDDVTMQEKRPYVRNNPQTMGKPDQVIKSQMFKSLSELGPAGESSQDHGVPELITINMYWNDLPGLLINGRQFVRLVDIHKQVLPAKPTGLLKNRCRALGMEIKECSELQRDFLIRYAHAAASRSQIIVTKEVAETLIGYYVDKPPVKKADDSASLADGSTYSYNADDIARLEDVNVKPSKKKKKMKTEMKYYYDVIKPRGRPKGAAVGSSCVNITFKLGGEVFQKRVQTSGFSLLGESDSEDSDSELDEKMSSTAVRFQKILNLRSQIKSIRAEIYAIQKRQQRADVRKAKGLAKRQRWKQTEKQPRTIFRFEPKRVLSMNSAPFLQPSEKPLLPTVRVAPNVESSARSSSPSSISPTPQTPNVIVESCTPFNAVPSAIVTPLNSRLEDDSGIMGGVDTSLDSSYLESDISKNTEISKVQDSEENRSFCSDVVLVKPDEDLKIPLPPFRCSTPSDNGKAPTRLAIQHYTGVHDCQNGYLYLNMFVSTKSSCIRCATCFQLLTVPEFLNHLHSADDGATLIRHSITKPRLLMLQDEQFLSTHQQSLWQQFQSKTTPSLSPVRDRLKKKETITKRKLKQNVQLARIGRNRTMSFEPKIHQQVKPAAASPAGSVLVKAARPAERRSLPHLGKSALPDSSRYSGRVRKRKQFSPDEGYTIPKTVDEPKLKKSRSESLIGGKRSPVVRITPLSGTSYPRPVCKVSPRPVAKISPVQTYRSPDQRHRHRSGQR